MKQLTFLCTFILLLAACQSDDVFKGNTQEKDFSLTLNVNVKVSTTADNVQGAHVLLFTEYPYDKTGMTIVASPILTSKTPVDRKVEIPKAAKKLYVLVNGELTTFDRGNINMKIGAGNNQTRAVSNEGVATVPQAIINYLNEQYPENSLYSDKSLAKIPETLSSDLVVQEANTDVWITLVSVNIGLTNSLYFYKYTPEDVTNGILPTISEEDNLIMHNPRVDSKDAGSPPNGTRYYLGQFQPGERIGFAVKCDWSAQYATYNKNFKYSTPAFNQIVNGVSESMGVMRSFSLLGNQYVSLGMEDSFKAETSWYDYDYNDILCLIEANPSVKCENELAPPEIAKGKTVYAGMWLFEDNYPNQGDYDFNDVVAAYYIEEMDDEPTLARVSINVVALGATYINKLGIRGNGLNTVWLIDDGSLSGFMHVGSDQPKTETPILEFTITRPGEPTGETAEKYIAVLNNGLPGGKDFDITTPNRFNLLFPNALRIPVSDFRWCLERKRIDEAYGRYTSWVENGCGDIDADWYMYPTNTSLLYNNR
jgi:hypothetical protein